MNILAHRGLWANPDERNSFKALTSAIDKNLGIETDIRDHLGRVVVRHDMGFDAELDLNDLLNLVGEKELKIALNVKASEMGPALAKLFLESEPKNYFFFDLAIPDLRKYLDLGLNTYCRVSEVEQQLVWSKEIKGVWVDTFSGLTVSKNMIDEFLGMNLDVSLVSEEIHGREHLHFWDVVSEYINDSRVSVCTDYPLELYDFLYGSSLTND